MINKKENLLNYGLYNPIKPLSENQRKWKERQALRSCQRTKKAMEHEGISNTSCNWCTQNNLKRLGKGAGRVGNQRTSRNHPNYRNVKIGQNSEMGSGDLRRHAVSQIPMKNHQLTLSGKN